MLKRQEGGMTREEVKQVNKMSTIMERFYNRYHLRIFQQLPHQMVV